MHPRAISQFFYVCVAFLTCSFGFNKTLPPVFNRATTGCFVNIVLQLNNGLLLRACKSMTRAEHEENRTYKAFKHMRIRKALKRQSFSFAVEYHMI